MDTTTWILLASAAGVAVLLGLAVRRVPEGAHWTVERFGRYTRTLEPGLRLLLPAFERVGAKQVVSERLLTLEPFEVATVDLVPLTVRASLCIQVVDAAKASYEVADMAGTAVELLRASLTGVVGGMTLDDALAARDDLGTRVIDDLDASCSAWGVQVTRVDLSGLEPPAELLAARTATLAAEQAKLAAEAQAEQDKAVAIAQAQQEQATAAAAAEQARAVAEQDAEQARSVAVLAAEQDRDVETARAQQERDVAIAEAEQARETARIAAEQEREATEHAVAQEHLRARREAEEAREIAALQAEAERIRVVGSAEAEQERVELLARATERRAEADARAMALVSEAIRSGGAQAASFQLAREYIDALRAAAESGKAPAVPADGGPVKDLLSVAPLADAAAQEAAAGPAAAAAPAAEGAPTPVHGLGSR